VLTLQKERPSEISIFLMKIRKTPKICRNNSIADIMNILLLEVEFDLQVEQTLVR
jgi:hypothetical protein